MITFRIYSRATKGGGAVVKSTSSGGGVVKSTSSGGGNTATSSNGGGVAKSTASGGGTVTSSGAAINWMDGISAVITGSQIENGDGTHFHMVPGIDNLRNHTHNVTIPAHSHSFDVPNHQHSVNIPAHTHNIDVPNHTHEINVPNHTHEIEHGIFKMEQLPTKLSIKVDGNTLPHTAINGDSIDLIPYLALDDQNRVVRGWHTVEITPDRIGRIYAQLMVQFFMQSRGGVDA